MPLMWFVRCCIIAGAMRKCRGKTIAKSWSRSAVFLELVDAKSAELFYGLGSGRLSEELFILIVDGCPERSCVILLRKHVRVTISKFSHAFTFEFNHVWHADGLIFYIESCLACSWMYYLSGIMFFMQLVNWINVVLVHDLLSLRTVDGIYFKFNVCLLCHLAIVR